MSISENVRLAEQLIDASIGELPIWRHARPAVLNALLACYRELIEVSDLMMARALQLGQEPDVVGALADERNLNAGMLWSLKLAMVHAKEDGTPTAPSDDHLFDLIVDTAPAYEILVDALKCADKGVVTIQADIPHQILTIDQGGDRTGWDLSMLATQWATDPLHVHASLTADDDQLTSRWTAGEFRRASRWLSERAEEGEGKEVVSILMGRPEPLFNRPTIINIPGQPPDEAIARVLEDLTMDPLTVSGDRLWKVASWLDMPLVRVGTDRRAASNVLLALVQPGGESHMLRIAARVDPVQYSRVSGLREERMIAQCRTILESRGWRVADRVRHAGPPPREIDVLAKRDAEILLLQLKSILRPESPWEVLKRNEEVQKGISHTSDVRARVAGAVGVVVTDGYRGDFATWSEALRNNVTIATLQELDCIAVSPSLGIEHIRTARGIGREPPKWATPPNGEVRIVGWTIRLTGAV